MNNESETQEEEAAPESTATEEQERDSEALAPEEEAKQADPETEPAAPDEPEPEVEPLEHQLIRLRADFDNYRKRVAREKAQWTQQALGNLIEDLLPVLDHYEMGLKNAEQHELEAGIMQGFQMVQEQLQRALGKYQLNEMVCVGEAFDPEQHEAISMMPSEQPADTIIDQARKGYTLGDRLLRPAQVVVSNGPAEDTAAATEEGDEDVDQA